MKDLELSIFLFPKKKSFLAIDRGDFALSFGILTPTFTLKLFVKNRLECKSNEEDDLNMTRSIKRSAKV